MSFWAFIDNENIPNFQHLKLEKYDRILVFCGPRNKKLKIDQLPTDGFCRLEFLRISTTGKNNLDFHLAFHLGCLHREAKQNVAFHIISKDHGFDGLVTHLKEMNRHCKSIEPKIELSGAAKRIRDQLDKSGRSRPRKQASLLKWIANHIRESEPTPEKILKELRSAGLLTVVDTNVSYTLDAK